MATYKTLSYAAGCTWAHNGRHQATSEHTTKADLLSEYITAVFPAVTEPSRQMLLLYLIILIQDE